MADWIGLLGGMFNQPKPEQSSTYDWQPEDRPVFSPMQQPVSFKPSARYITNNLAPEKSLTANDIANLGNARKIAEKNGVIPKELGEYMLPMAMVEGRSGNFGIRGNTAFYPHQATRRALTNTGLQPGDMYINDRGLLAPTNTEDSNTSARLMAGILAEKHRINPTKDIEGTIKLYNGKGKAREDLGNGTYHPADTSVYWGKVREAKAMLDHPSNKELKDLFNRYYAE